MNYYTHKGWLGPCPIYIRNPEGECPDIMPRWQWANPLAHFAVWLQRQAIDVCLLMNPEWTPTWAIRVTGKI